MTDDGSDADRAQRMMDKLNRKDVRFVGACLAVVLVGALVTAALFRRAFPEASIEFRVNRIEARALAQKFLTAQGRTVGSHRFAARFGVEETPKVYLERELGLEKAGRFYGREAKVWRWELRWFRSGVKEEERVAITPLGDLAAYHSVRRDDAPGPRLSQGEARRLALGFLRSRGLKDLRPIEASPVARPKRKDWIFVDERPDLRMGEATVRYATTVSGDEVTGFREFVHVPEAWEREYGKLRSKNDTANLVGNFGLFLTLLAMLGVLVRRITRKDVPWGLVGAFGGTALLLYLLTVANQIPLTLFGYDTASPLSGHMAKELILGVLNAVGVGAFVALLVAAAEPIYRERFPQQQSLSGIFSRRGFRSKRFFLGVLLGYALTAFFFAYQAVFYVVAADLGAWAPAEIPYDDILNTAFPWVTVLFIGFLPAVSEEAISRMFSISFLDRLGVGRLVAVVLPALIWGFNHAAYPNQPFYIRGVEVGVAGIVIGFLMLRFGVLPLLVWHFTVDALYTALLLLRSGDPYYVVSGAVCSGILLLPLGISLVLYWRRGGFESEAGLTNRDEGFVPASPARALTAEPVAPVRPVPAKVFALTGGAALLLAAGFLFPAPTSESLARDHTGRRRAERLARDFLQVNGGSPDRYRVVSSAGTGFVSDEQLRGLEPQERGDLPQFAGGSARYVVETGGLRAFRRLGLEKLPLACWVVRFVQAEKKEEWKILVDARRARVIGFVNPKEEAASAPGAPDAEKARGRVLAAAAQLGYPVKEYSVIEVGSKARPKRTDTTVVLESGVAGVPEARSRLTAVFHGGRLAAFYPSIRVPESYLRGLRRRSAAGWALVAAKIVSIGAFVGVAIILFLRILRRPEFRVKALARPLTVVGILAAAALAGSFPTLLRLYRTDQPLSLFQVSMVVLQVILWILILCAAGVGFTLFSGARPGWRRALRRSGSLSDALLRAGIAAAGLAGISRATDLVLRRFPSFLELDVSLPGALEPAVPAVSVLWSTSIATFVIAAAASAAALACGEPFFRRAAGKAVLAVGILFALAPSFPRSAGDFAADFLPALLSAAWLGVAAFLLLRDHAAAWVLFGVLAYGVPVVVELLAQPSPADQVAGWTSLAAILLGASALVLGRRERQPEVSPEMDGLR